MRCCRLFQESNQSIIYQSIKQYQSTQSNTKRTQGDVMWWSIWIVCHGRFPRKRQTDRQHHHHHHQIDRGTGTAVMYGTVVGFHIQYGARKTDTGKAIIQSSESFGGFFVSLFQLDADDWFIRFSFDDSIRFHSIFDQYRLGQKRLVVVPAPKVWRRKDFVGHPKPRKEESVRMADGQGRETSINYKRRQRSSALFSSNNIDLDWKYDDEYSDFSVLLDLWIALLLACVREEGYYVQECVCVWLCFHQYHQKD